MFRKDELGPSIFMDLPIKITINEGSSLEVLCYKHPSVGFGRCSQLMNMMIRSRRSFSFPLTARLLT